MDRLVLGLVPSDRVRARDPRTRHFLRALEEKIGAYVVERNVANYEELERDMTLARIHIAWLPPMVYARLEYDNVATPLVMRAASGRRYWSAMVVSAASPLQRLSQLAGTCAAWVDPLSSAGYLVARMGLRANGVEPRTCFRQQFFAGSHTEAIDAVLQGHADVAATFVHVDDEGHVVRGPWDEMGVPAERVRVLALLGEIPPDVIAARTSVPEGLRDSITGALLGMVQDDAFGGVLDAVFGGRRFERGSSERYKALRELLERAAQSGAYGATDAYSSTSPPSKAKP